MLALKGSDDLEAGKLNSPSNAKRRGGRRVSVLVQW